LNRYPALTSPDGRNLLSPDGGRLPTATAWRQVRAAGTAKKHPA